MTIRIFGLMGLGALALAACGQAGDTPAQPTPPADAPEGAAIDIAVAAGAAVTAALALAD